MRLSDAGLRWNEPLGGNRLLPEKNRKIRGWRRNVEVIQNVRGMATVICGVVDDMKQNISARHGSATAANELKLNDFTQFTIRDCIGVIHVPIVHFSLRPGQLLHYWM